jgi:hypothetical protein
MTYELHSYTDSNIQLEYSSINNKNLCIILELYRGKLFSHIINDFINDAVNLFGVKIFSVKKPYKRTLTNLISSWMFTLYASENFNQLQDPFLPNNYNEVSSLELILKDLVKYDTTLINTNDLIKKLLTNLKNNFGDKVKILESYKKSKYYQDNKNKYLIEKKEVLDRRDYGDFKFYKFTIKLGFEIKDKKLIDVLNYLLIPIDEYNKLKEFYNGDNNKMDELITIIIYRYQLLGSNNHQLGVKPDIMYKMKKDYNLNYECFASSINCTFNHYCSVYYDVEKYFGSFGSFFNLTPIRGTFGLNPPYQKEIIETCIIKALGHLEEADKEGNVLTFIITIPIWDNEGKKQMKEEFNNDLPQQNIDYGDFKIISTVQNSVYHKITRMIPKEKFTYIDHNHLLIKNKTIQNTYVIVITTNNDFDPSFIMSYDFY